MQRNETTTRRGTLHCLENGPYTLVSCPPKLSRERERERESITETVCMVKSFLTQYYINEATR